MTDHMTNTQGVDGVNLTRHEDGSYMLIDADGRELTSTGESATPMYVDFENEDGTYKTMRSVALLNAGGGTNK